LEKKKFDKLRDELSHFKDPQPDLDQSSYESQHIRKEGSQDDSEEQEGKISNFLRLKEQLFGPEMVEMKQKLQDLVNLQN